jgi:hypothetical protein
METQMTAQKYAAKVVGFAVGSAVLAFIVLNLFLWTLIAVPVALVAGYKVGQLTYGYEMRQIESGNG